MTIIEPQEPMTSSDATSIFITTADGLRLHARCHGRRADRSLPVICLPGLTHTAAHFEPLATALASDPQKPRFVIALDYRGRGLSDYDPEPAHYNVQTELADVLTVTEALDCLPAVFIGTSRGGILSMLLATVRPETIAGVVLNDIGPVIELAGLLHIKPYVGKLPRIQTFEQGAAILRRLFEPQFPRLTRDDWLAAARRTFKQDEGRLVTTYDIALSKTLESVDAEHPLPPLWDAFDALAGVPAMAIRGANSTLLSPATLQAMAARHPALETLEVPEQGHPPLLAEPDVIARIADFIDRCGRGG
jgi:pimeloyl-ACP methyl ester carboxylesterase